MDDRGTRGGKKIGSSGEADLGCFEDLSRRAREIGVDIDPGRARLLRLHFERLLAANRGVNLTRVTDPEEALTKLYLSSLAVLPALAEVGVDAFALREYLDLGTGAGFPGIPIAAACPHLSATLIDARAKKVRFLRDAVQWAGIENVVAVHARGAEYAVLDPSARGRFHLITSRAVSALGATLREVMDLAAAGGVIAVFKGPGLAPEELREGLAVADDLDWEYLGEVRPRVANLSPRLLLFRKPIPPS